MEIAIVYIGMFIVAMAAFSTGQSYPDMSIWVYAIPWIICCAIVGTILHFIRKVFK